MPILEKIIPISKHTTSIRTSHWKSSTLMVFPASESFTKICEKQGELGHHVAVQIIKTHQDCVPVYVFCSTTAPSLSMKGTRGPGKRAGKRAGKRGGKRGGNLGFSSNVSSLFNFNHCSLDLVLPSWQNSFDTWGSSGCPSGYSFASHRLMINSKLYRFLRSWRPLIPGGTMM